MRCIVVLLCLCCCAAARADQEPPRVLVDAAQCLATGKQDWLGLTHSRPVQLELGYVASDKSRDGEDLLYVVDFTTPLHSQGLVFTILQKGKEPRETLQVEYGAPFRQSIDGNRRVELVNPPFGGIGTQEALISAVRQTGFEETYSLPIANVLDRPAPVRCEAAPGTP